MSSEIWGMAWAISRLKVSPQIPLYFKGILQSAVFLSDTFNPMSAGQGKDNKTLKNRKH